MSKLILILVIAAVLAVGIGGYFLFMKNYQGLSYNQTIIPNQQNQQQTSPAQQPPTQTNSTVSIKNFTFNPGTLTIAAGTTVVWTNGDPVTHRIKSDTFNSNNLNQGDSFQFKFDNKGTYNYSCAIHPSMLGKIIVK